jgi:hypothetical protein
MVLRQWPLCQKKEDGSLCFSPNDSRANEVVLGNEKVCLLKQMKILGLIFDSKLNWYYQTVNAIENANKAKQALRIISKFFSTQEMVKLSNCTFLQKTLLWSKGLAFFSLVCNSKTLASIIKNAKNLSKGLARTVFF